MSEAIPSMAGARRRVFRAEPSSSASPLAGAVLGHLLRTDRALAAEATADTAARPPADRVAHAFTTVASDLDTLARELHASGKVEPAHIVEATVHIVLDPELRQLVDETVVSGETPETATRQAIEHFAGMLAQIPDPTLAARAADVRAVGRRLIAALASDNSAATYAGALAASGAGTGTEAAAAAGAILVADEITADDLLVHSGTVVGAATVLGSATSHAAIVARSLGVPMVFGTDPAVLDAPDGIDALLDPSTGAVVLHPNLDERHAARQLAVARAARRSELAAARGQAVSTRDGQEVTVLANVASVADADLAIAMGAAGVGLLRTEMPLLTAEHWPTYAEHVARLEPVLRRLTGLAVTIRTLDFADDKLPPFLRAGRSGPLGRSLPLMLAEPDAFSAQLRAVLATSVDCGVNLRIMVPMVVAPDELRLVRGLTAKAAAELGTPAPPIGAMIELPEAITAVNAIAAESDFLSIGSNDLTASILGLGRRDPFLTTTRILEPAVLDAVDAVVSAGRTHRRGVSVCGDAASDPSTVPALVGRGCSILSVAPSMLDEVRAAVRSL